MNILETEDVLLTIFKLLDSNSGINYFLFLSFVKPKSRIVRIMRIHLKEYIRYLVTSHSAIINELKDYSCSALRRDYKRVLIEISRKYNYDLSKYELLLADKLILKNKKKRCIIS